ncbi:MAG: DUF393 domain-containing protein [Deltaproteobacteria bacterium]|nr:DUF393 domain-containing protein [Deltaproteobacteria bacterium]
MELVLYDGVCGLCDRLVRFVIDHDPEGRFRFAPLQSAVAAEILARHGHDPHDLDTLWVAVDRGTPEERLLRKSRAALHVLGRLRTVFRALAVLAVLPTFVLDFLYDRVARARYGIWGKYDSCPAPRPEDRSRFVEGTS